MQPITFVEVLGWSRVSAAARSAIRLAESFSKYAARSPSMQDRIENFSSAIYQNATDWQEATKGFGWWQQNAVLLGLSYHLYWCTPKSGDFLELRMSKKNLISHIGQTPLCAEFLVQKYISSGSDDGLFRLKQESFHVPIRDITLGRKVTFEQIRHDLAEWKNPFMEKLLATTQEKSPKLAWHQYPTERGARLLYSILALTEALRYGPDPVRANAYAEIGSRSDNIWIHSETYQYLALDNHPEITSVRASHGYGWFIPCTPSNLRNLILWLGELLDWCVRT